MKFIFTCPITHQAFETDAFRILEDKGIRTDASGHRIWDARIELLDPCPVCGAVHRYNPEDLPCPFNSPPDGL